ncbi:hypothetical protein IPA_08450 [Ignicoccus pacificus DSM 13166]|uniref:Uncharacterized protein n=1 Tax=Ignicoccus pacificus DSM 13166 TaxID=940294 RepID=A0A977KCP8_9CREN|nr:hypothetical protein IPA_08450 [Ignicoccus pacificus DSM 13166]
MNKKVMSELLDKVLRIYDDLFMEIVYRAHHNSFKVSYADIFYDDFVNYIVAACGLKRRIFWRYLPKESTLRYMYERRKGFFKNLGKRSTFEDNKRDLDFWLSQLSFWYGTVKAFANVWATVVLDKEDIPQEVDWEEAIVLYIISDFKESAKNSNYCVVRKRWVEKYKYYLDLEQVIL